jgi:hypothetical protein
MEPLKPELKERVLALRPEADPADLDEYERLLAERFAADPDQAPAPHPEALMEDKESAESRLAELYEKLFGGEPETQ